MKVSELMTTAVKTCSPSDSLHRVAQIMWDNDCGCVPVVDSNARVTAMLTDRDVCMAAYTQGRPLTEIEASSAASKEVFGVYENDLVEAAEAIMQQHQVRRLPVLDGDGRLRGLISLNNIASRVIASGRGTGLSSDAIARTLAAVSAPHAAGSMATRAHHMTA